LLERDPSKRIASAAELLREIERVERHIKAGAVGHGPIASADRLLLTGRRAAPLWRNTWAIGFLILALGIGLWVAFRPSSAPPEVAVEQHAPAYYLLRAKRARIEKKFDLAEDLCHILTRYYSGTKEAQWAEEELKRIQEARAAEAAPAK
jgi:hypothetical protein